MERAQFFQQLFSLEGQTALITGGSGALGSEMAQALAQAGASVVIMGRRAQACEQVAARIRAAGGQALGIAGDVLDLAALERAAREIATALGQVDILVNAAGGNQPQATTSAERPFFALESEIVAQVLEANFRGTFQTCQVFGRAMAERGQGCIVNIA
jgi:NAD(P)-dependent dehydrogenase (short-subunit alcohol dehydrogenase family)